MKEKTPKAVSEQDNKALYEFRKLQAKDIAPMCRVINKIGMKNVRECLDLSAVASTLKEEDNKNSSVIGMHIAMEFATLIVERYPDCENEILALLSGVCNLSKNEIKELPMAAFFEMLVDFAKKEEFMDFFSVASKLLK